MAYNTDRETVKELMEHGLAWGLWQQPPTGFDIVEQMPVGTKLQTLVEETGGLVWECVFDIDQSGHYQDGRQDPCPHKAAAKAFLAWKKGLI